MDSFDMELDFDGEVSDVTVEYSYFEADESVGCSEDFEFYVFLDDKDITWDLTDEQSKEIYRKCKENHDRHFDDYE